MQSSAPTVASYLASLPADRRAAVAVVRGLVLDNLDSGFEENMSSGMICYYVPHKLFPAGYHCDPKQPLPFAGLASQKNYMSLYLMGEYFEGLEEGGANAEADWFRKEWAKSGKKLDMGKCCIRFKKVDDLALNVIAKAIKRMTVKRFVDMYEGTRAAYAASKATKTPAKKLAAKKSK